MTDIRADLAGRLAPAERSDFLATLLRVARADEVSPAERDRLQPLAEWLGASDDDLTNALLRANDEKVLLADLVSHFDELVDRFLLFREACAVVWVDGYRTQDEENLLDKLALLLGIEEDPRDVMDSPLACSPEGERRFLELLALTHEARHVEQEEACPPTVGGEV